DFHVTGVQTCALPIYPPVVTPLNLGYQFMSENLCDEAEEHIRDLRRAITGFGMPLRTTEHESGPGQMEFTFAPLDALAAADAMEIGRASCRGRGWAPG